MDKYPHALEFVPECFLTQNMYYKAVNTYPRTIKLVPKHFTAQEMCDKAVNRFFCIYSIPKMIKKILLLCM